MSDASEPLELSATQRAYAVAIASTADIDEDRIDVPATVVVAEPSRAGSGLAVGYVVAGFTVIRCDPEHSDALMPYASESASVGLEGLVTIAADLGWRSAGGADNHVLDASPVPLGVPDGLTIERLDPASPLDRTRIAALVEAAGPDDADEAEVDLDELDPAILALTDAAGAIAVYTSAQAWELDLRFDDIGVLTHPDYRQQGCGAAAVSAFCTKSLSAGRSPLYRCDWANNGSKQLALRVGFVQCGRLFAFGPPTADDAAATG